MLVACCSMLVAPYSSEIFYYTFNLGVPLYMKISRVFQDLRARSASWMLDRKASVGPCYRKSMPFGEPSGITISLPKVS